MQAGRKIAILGCQGQLGTSLRNLLSDNALALSRLDLDLSDLAKIPDVIPRLAADVIVNCAAYNLVDKAEDDPQAAWNLNWRVPFELAKVCRDSGKKLVQISTDYVFSKSRLNKSPYSEIDLPAPETVYGLSKLAGEHAVMGYCPNHLVIRTCGLFGKAERGGKMNFVDMMLKKATAGETIKVVNDQKCSPTSTDHLAWGIKELIDADAQGVFHVVNRGSVTWFEFAAMIFKHQGLQVDMIPVTTASFGAKAKRPEYSVLNTEKFKQATGKQMPDLSQGLQDYLTKYHA